MPLLLPWLSGCLQGSFEAEVPIEPQLTFVQPEVDATSFAPPAAGPAHGGVLAARSALVGALILLLTGCGWRQTRVTSAQGLGRQLRFLP